MKPIYISLIFVIAIIAFLIPVIAHQPFFENSELTASNPKHIEDPTISTAIYAALQTPNDVDYYTFNGTAGESILLSITTLKADDVHRMLGI